VPKPSGAVTDGMHAMPDLAVRGALYLMEIDIPAATCGTTL
jgi:hypothetical protein